MPASHMVGSVVWVAIVLASSIQSLRTASGQDATAVTHITLGEDGNECVLWRHPIGHAAAQISIADDGVVVATSALRNGRETGGGARSARGAVVYIDAEQGELLWHITHSHRDNDDSFCQSFLGVMSRPTIDSEQVFYVSNRGELVCLDIHGFADGEDDGVAKYPMGSALAGANLPAADVVWKLDMISQLGVYRVDSSGGNPACSPCVWEDMVFCVTGNGRAFEESGPTGVDRIRAPNAPSFIAVRRSSGDVVWSSKAPGLNLVYSWSSPVVWTGGPEPIVVFPGGDGILYCFAARTGELKTQLDLNKPSATYWTRERGTRCFFVAPLVIDENVIYVGLATDLYGKTLDSPLVAVSLRHGDGLTASAAWKFHDRDFDCTYSRAIVHGPHVFTVSEDTGSIFAVDRVTGECRKSLLDVINGPRLNGFPSPCVTPDGVLWIPTLDGLLGVTADENMEKIAVLEFDELLIGSPEVSDGVLYVPTKGQLYALDYTLLQMRLRESGSSSALRDLNSP